MFCSVNLFVMISANFLTDDNTIKLRSIITLLAENWIINFAVVIVSAMIFKAQFSKIDIIYILFPFFTRRNWFICVYLVLYLLHPFLNIIIQKIDYRSHRILMFILIGLFSVLPSIMPNRNWTFDGMYGYSIIWFVVLYFTTAFIKKSYTSNRSRNVLNLCMYLLLGFVMLFSKFFVTIVAKQIGVEALLQYRNIWFSYDSLPVYTMGVLIFKIFYSQNIFKNFNSRIAHYVSLLGSSTLGVYLIHDNYKIREFLWSEMINVQSFSMHPYSFLVYLVIAIAVFLICSVIYYCFHRIYKRLTSKLKIMNKNIVIE